LGAIGARLSGTLSNLPWFANGATRLSHLRRHEGKLDVLRVECTRCDRKGRYTVAKLIEKHGPKGNLMVWREMLNATVPGGMRGYMTAATWSAPICRNL
jgi:hypothetical protein